MDTKSERDGQARTNRANTANGGDVDQRAMGRPRERQEAYDRLTIELPASMVQILDGYRMGQTRRAFIEDAIRHWFGHTERRLRGDEDAEDAECNAEKPRVAE